MTTEPELPYFPLPLEHERPTRRWGAYRADVVVVVDGVEWGFRYFANELFFTKLPFLLDISKIFLIDKWTCLPSENSLIDVVRDFTVDDMSGDKAMWFSRVLKLPCATPFVVNLYPSGNSFVVVGDHEGFYDQFYMQCTKLDLRANGTPPIPLNESLNLGATDFVEMDNGILESIIVEQVDWYELSQLALNTLPLEKRDQTFFNLDNECGDKAKIVECLKTQKIIDSNPRKEFDLSFDRIIACSLRLEDDIWERNSGCDNQCVFAVVTTESQFSPALCGFSCDLDDHDQRIEERMLSNRLTNIVDIALDEFCLKGARFSEGMLETPTQLPFYSAEFGVGFTTKPSQHEKLESLMELKEWLLSIDIFSQDVDLLLIDKLPKGWLSQQPKIKW